ncbi:MAG: molybdenum cofactor biosynthesis protein B [Acidobacteriota bacterium]
MSGPGASVSPHHRHRAEGPQRLGVAILTVSDTRSAATDLSGDLMEELARAAGHHVHRRDLVPDDPAPLAACLTAAAADPGVDLILVNGGTGLAPRDRSVETVQKHLHRCLPGFGELFRALSFQEIGSAAMASRALAGVIGTTLIFCTPGSPAAVRLAMEKLILPEASHLVGQLRQDG